MNCTNRVLSRVVGALAIGVLVTAACGGSKGEGSGLTSGGGSSGGGSSGSSGGSGGGDAGGGSFASSSGGGGDDEAGPTGPATTCAEAAAEKSYIGCDYWPTVTYNTVNSSLHFAAVVANAGTNTATITITGAGVNQTATVAPGSLTTIDLPWVSALKGPAGSAIGTLPSYESVLATKSAYHLVSTFPVTVYQFNALEYVLGSTYSYSNDASLLLPTTAMTGNYSVVAHEGWTYNEFNFITVAAQPAFVAITATADNTTVKVKVSSAGHIASGNGIADTAAGSTLTLTMNAGDVAQVVGGTEATSDLSGSIIAASAPVQVITGMPCVYVPADAAACDHVEESLLPFETLGQDYVVAQPLQPETGAPVGQLVRIYGDFDGTTLTYSPSAPPGCPSTVGAGEVVECGIVDQDFEVKGSEPFSVAVFSQGATVVDPTGSGANQQGDPDQSLPTAVEQYRSSYIFLAPTSYEENYVVAIAPPGTTITIDGAAPKAAPAAINSSYSVWREKLGAGQSGAHTLVASAPAAIQVMGYGSYTSYQYPGGLDLKYVNSQPPPPVQ